MMHHVKPVLYVVVGAIIALVLYNMFIVGHFGMFEGSNNYEVDEQGNITQNGMHVAA